MNQYSKNAPIRLVRQLMSENERLKTMPSRTLARWLNENHFDVFPNIEMARGIVRTARGKNGEARRKSARNPEFYDIQLKYDMPQTKSDEYAAFDIPKAVDRLLWLPDVHVPFHDETALSVAIKYGLEHGANGIMLAGDFADQYWMSHFVKIGQRHPFTYAQELDAVRHMLDYLMDVFDGCQFFYKFGNHEDRFEAYLNRVPEFRGIDDFSLPHLLELRERGFTVIESNTYMNYGKLKMGHGHEWGRGNFSPVNMARGLYLKAKQSAICAHGHTTSEHSAKKMDGTIITCYSTGCLCDLHPHYRPLNDTNHGFAFIERGEDWFHVDNRRIYNGKIM